MSITVEVVVSDAQKSFWKEHAEQNPKYDHLSDLVRTAVAEQIARDTGDDNVPDDIENMFLDIQTEFEDLQSKLAIANGALEDIQHTQVDEQTLEDVLETYSGMIRRDIKDMTPDEENEGQAGE